MIINLHLPITPKALPRARHTSRGGYVQSYYTRDTEATFDEYQNAIIHAVSRLNELQRESIKFMLTNVTDEIFIRFSVVFRMPIPKSISNKRKIAMEMKPHIKKPDLDNAVKMILDRASGILFDDDKRIACIKAEKVYSENVGIDLTIEYEAL